MKDVGLYKSRFGQYKMQTADCRPVKNGDCRKQTSYKKHTENKDCFFVTCLTYQVSLNYFSVVIFDETLSCFFIYSVSNKASRLC